MKRTTIIQSVSMPVDLRKILVREAKKRKITISEIMVAGFNFWMEKEGVKTNG